MYYLKNADGHLILDRHDHPRINIARIFTHIVITIFVVITLSLGGYPVYNVWSEGLKGEAELRRAEQNRRIAVEEALATAESAKSYADAEVTRARGVAEANSIIQDGLGGPNGYLRYLWIQNLPNARTVYIPTEAGMPITEAARIDVVSD